MADIPQPEETYQDDLYRFIWPAIEGASIDVTLERFTETSDDIRCEAKIMYDDGLRSGRAYRGKLLLSGPNSLRDVTTSCNNAIEFPKWSGIIGKARELALDHFREGEPPTDLREDMESATTRYLVRPFILDRGITIFYGSEESAKSLTMTTLAVAVASGQEIAGLVAEDVGPVAYLDWEDDAGTARERLVALCAGAGIDVSACHIEHKRMVASLSEARRDVKLWLGHINARMAIIDSLGMACGGDPNDPSLLIKTMIAARSLDVPIAAIHHLAKDAKDKSRPYGSVYAAAEARMTWLVEKEDAQKRDPGKLKIALTNMKANRSKRHPRQSFEFLFDVDEDTEALRAVSVTPLGFTDTLAVGTGAGQKWRILEALKGKPLSVDEIAAHTGITKASIRTQLSRHEDMFHKNEDGKWGLYEYSSRSEEPVISEPDPW